MCFLEREISCILHEGLENRNLAYLVFAVQMKLVVHLSVLC